MAQLRDGYEEITSKNTVILVVGPDNRNAFSNYWEEHDLPFIGIPDPAHRVLKLYGQQVKIFKLGRMPAMAIIDPEGQVRFVHYGESMSDIPTNQEVLSALDEINIRKDG
jgi:peroxiredoxin Q/BCP